MREKLIEILRKPIFPHELADPTEVVADYLLDNDVVPVVRCKDCKYMEKARWHYGYRCGNPCDGMASGVELRDNDFCSYGERREVE